MAEQEEQPNQDCRDLFLIWKIAMAGREKEQDI